MTISGEGPLASWSRGETAANPVVRSGAKHRQSASTLSTQLRRCFGLTRMETVVACALTEGLSYKEIANRFRISYHTVHSHVKAIHSKVGISSNIRLLALIRREGWK